MIYLLSLSARSDGVRVHLRGEVDLSVSGHLYEVLGDAVAQSLGTVEVDLRGLQFLDCSGIAALLRARDDARRSAQVLFVSRPRGMVRQALDLTGTLSMLTAETAPLPSPPVVTDLSPPGAPEGPAERAVG